MDILSLPTEVDKTKIDSRFRLILIAAQRVRQLSAGAKPVVTTRYSKNTTIALQEVISDKVDYITGKDAVKALEVAKRLELRRPDIKLKEERGEELTEIEKDLKVYLIEKAEEEKKREKIFG